MQVQVRERRRRGGQNGSEGEDGDSAALFRVARDSQTCKSFQTTEDLNGVYGRTLPTNRRTRTAVVVAAFQRQLMLGA